MRVRSYQHNNNTIVIAPRRSGKTERLINFAIQHAEEHIDNFSVIVATSFHEARRLQFMAIQRLGYSTEKIKFFSITNIGRNSNIWRNMLPNGNVKFYFDEFEQMDERLPVNLDNAYYISSPLRRFENSQTFRIMDNWGISEFHQEELEFAQNYDEGFHERRQRMFERENFFMRDEEVQDLTDRIINSAVRQVVADDTESDDSYLYRIGA